MARGWVKICGTTSLEDALLAVDAGADAVGFVFAPSARQVTAEQVGRMTARLPRSAESYGVFVRAPFEEIVETVKGAGLTGVQLHSAPEPESELGPVPGLALRLREHFSAIPARPRVGIVQVLHFSGATELEAALGPLTHDHAVDAVLVDSRTAIAVGGTGQRFDWQGGRESFRRTAPHLRLVAAGGLSPSNVAEAVDTLRPWGVDVVTGVEAAPGRKDPEKVRAFVANARRAFAGVREQVEAQAAKR